MTQCYFGAARTLLLFAIITLTITLTTAMINRYDLPPLDLEEFKAYDFRRQYLLAKCLTEEELDVLKGNQYTTNFDANVNSLDLEEIDRQNAVTKAYLSEVDAKRMDTEINQWKARIAKARGVPAPPAEDFKAVLMGTQSSSSTSSREPPAQKSYKTVLTGSKQRRN